MAQNFEQIAEEAVQLLMESLAKDPRLIPVSALRELVKAGPEDLGVSSHQYFLLQAYYRERLLELGRREGLVSAGGEGA